MLKITQEVLTNTDIATELTITIQKIKLALLKAGVCFADIADHVLEREQFVGRLKHERFITEEGDEVYMELLIGLNHAEIELSIVDSDTDGEVFELAEFLENPHARILTYLNIIVGMDAKWNTIAKD